MRQTKPAGDAAVYARFSTDRQDARSIDDQVRRCRARAEDTGLRVVSTFQDAAVSGSHMDRAGMRDLLSAATRRGGSPFQAVLVDDLSRLSRDLGDTWNLVFNQLAAVGVRVVDCTTGMASDAPGARLTFGALGLVNDTFLQLVKTETHRGLEGRALAGFSTGGRVYGYRTEKEPNPPDPEHPRAIILVNPPEADVVRRIFAEYLEGRGLAAIAAGLNRDGIPAPYDSTSVPKRRGRGWGQGTIRAMLLNERYTGRVVWNRRKFVRVPGRRHRRAVERPQSEWRTLERPELAIIEPATWSATQDRFAGRAVTGRPLGSGRHPHLLSGIARCTCGAGFGVVGQRTKNGVRYVTMGCAAHASRGDAVCSNGLTVSERKLNEAVVGALRDVLLAPGLLRRFVERFNERVTDARSRPSDELARVESSLHQAEAAVRNLTDALARMGWSDAIQARLQDEERRLADLRATRAAMAGRAEVKPPDPGLVEDYVRGLLDTLEADPERGRELLRHHVGTVCLTPKASGGRNWYQAEGAFSFAPRNTKAPVIADGGSRLLKKTDCGGRI